jgi:hypothetical protein
MSVCTTSHDECKKSSAGGRLPFRLIDVIASGWDRAGASRAFTSHEFELLSLDRLPNVRIISSELLPSDTPYLTLSHRWVSRPNILLTKRSVHLLEQDISPYLLSSGETAVFQHAIHVTRCLGFRYIWIDALCIIQDDEEEKAIEITYMDEIYSNCVLNIAATEANIQKGLVFDRNLLRVNPCHVSVDVPETGERRHFQAYAMRAGMKHGEGLLNTRGWVFQERTLAQRVLHFTKDQVLWECPSLMASEVLPQGLHRAASLSFKGPPMGIAASEASSEYELRTKWNRLVWDFSGSAFSFIDDRLLAFSGIAKRFASAACRDPSDYIAGMWRSDLPLSLLWKQSTQETPGDAMMYAPSWSWAAVQAPSWYGGPPEFDGWRPDVVDLQFQRRSSNIFDGTVSCRLRLRAPVCKVRRQVRDGTPWIRLGEHAELREVEMVKAKDEMAISITWDLYTESVATCLDAERFAEAPPSYYLIFIAASPYRWHGLILRKTLERATYVRVGVFLVMSDIPCVEVRYALDSQLATLDEDEYLCHDSDGDYTIDII